VGKTTKYTILTILEQILMLLIIRIVSLWILLIPVSFAKTENKTNKFPSRENCPASVTSPQDAFDKADWVIEGTIQIIFTRNDNQGIEVILENAKTIQELEPSKISPTESLNLGPCFPGGDNVFRGKQANRFIGKRMRFFGNTHIVSPKRRFFYMQQVENGAFAPIEKRANKDALLTTKFHKMNAENRLPDGWHRARSTDGSFSIDLPGPFVDATKVDGGNIGFMLRATDQYGSTFIAVFERSGPNSEMAGTFDMASQKTGAVLSVFKGFPAVSTRSELSGKDDGLISHTHMFRVPGGTYMLGIATPRLYEAQSLQQKQRFFNSLEFN
jgi:hypothetical protein